MKTMNEDVPNDQHSIITIEDVNRVLEVGRLLRSVLTEEELEELQSMLSETKDLQSQEEQQIGNAGVT